MGPARPGRRPGQRPPDAPADRGRPPRGGAGSRPGSTVPAAADTETGRHRARESPRPCHDRRGARPTSTGPSRSWTGSRRCSPPDPLTDEPQAPGRVALPPHRLPPTRPGVRHVPGTPVSGAPARRRSGAVTSGRYDASVNSQQTPGFGTDVLEDTRLDERTQTTDNGDHERLSHYVPKDKLMEAMVNGTPGRRALRQGVGPQPGPEEVPGVPRVQGDLGRHA